MNRAGGCILLAVILGLGAAGANAAVIVDGTVSPADEWAEAVSVGDPNEGDISDQWDIREVLLKNGLDLYLRWDVQQGPPQWTSGGGDIDYAFQFYLPGEDTPLLYATSLPFFTTKGSANSFYLESDTAAATVNVGKYAVGGDDSVEAYIPYAAFAELGVEIPSGGLTLEFDASIINNIAEPDDVTPRGSFNVMVPEPATVTLICLGGLGTWLRRRKGEN